MYKIKCVNSAAEYPIYDTQCEDLCITSAKLFEGINKSGALEFTVPATNKNSCHIHTLQSEVIVNDVSGEEIYRGRPVTECSDIYNTTPFVCEGVLAYLLDTMYPPYDITCSIVDFIKKLLDFHNSRVSDRQKIYYGDIVSDDVALTGERHWKCEEYTSILDIMQQEIVNVYGGLLQIRRINGMNYLDYLTVYAVSDQHVRLGTNIIDLNRCLDASLVRTVIIPLGAEEDGQRIDITSVNNGKNYLVDEDLLKLYGWIEENIIFDEILSPEELLEKGKDYLTNCSNMKISVELNGIDCRMLGLDAGRLAPGMKVKVESDFHNLDTYFLCIAKETDLLNPANDKIILGNSIKTFTETTGDVQRIVNYRVNGLKTNLSQRIAQMKNELEARLNNSSGLYVTQTNQINGERGYYYHDKPALSDSMILLNFKNTGFRLSVDKGKNWYGMNIDNEFIANILSQEGINANWITSGEFNADLIQTGVIRSENFVENLSGTKFDLQTGIITSYSKTSSGLMRMVISPTRLEICILRENGTLAYQTVVNENGVSVTDYKSSATQTLNLAGGQISLICGKNTIAELNQNKMTINSSDIAFGGQSGKTGRAEFSDGSYMIFKNGLLVGGNTKEGGEI